MTCKYAHKQDLKKSVPSAERTLQPTRPRQHLYCDLIPMPKGQYSYILFCLDAYSQNVYALPLKDKIAPSVLCVTADDLVPAIKYLGVYFDPSLNFKFHINYLSKKISLAIFSLRSVKNILPQTTLVTLYDSLIHCHFLYACEIWGCTNQSNINDLFLKQKTAIRLICNKNFNAHTEPLFRKLEILKLPDLIELSKVKFMYFFR
jgi:hypothetical protein